MRGKVYFLLSILLVCLLIIEASGRVTDDEWQNLQQRFKEAYQAGKTPQGYRQRLQAVQKLSQADHPGLVKLFTEEVIPYELQSSPGVISFLGQKSAIREEVIKILGALKDDGAIRQLIQSTQQAPDPVKAVLIKSLGQIIKPEVSNELVGYLSNENACLIHLICNVSPFFLFFSNTLTYSTIFLSHSSFLYEC